MAEPRNLNFGFVCGAGILITMLTAVTLLPHWWRWLKKPVEGG